MWDCRHALAYVSVHLQLRRRVDVHLHGHASLVAAVAVAVVSHTPLLPPVHVSYATVCRVVYGVVVYGWVEEASAWEHSMGKADPVWCTCGYPVSNNKQPAS